MAIYLLTHGSTKVDQKCTLLDVSIIKGQTDLAQFIASSLGCDVSAIVSSKSPLCLALERLSSDFRHGRDIEGSKVLCSLLIAKGANVDRLTSDGAGMFAVWSALRIPDSMLRYTENNFQWSCSCSIFRYM